MPVVFSSYLFIWPLYFNQLGTKSEDMTIDMKYFVQEALFRLINNGHFGSVSSQNHLNMVPISRNSLLFIIHLIASLPCRPTPCRRRGRMRTASKIPALKCQAARRRSMR